MGLKSNFLKVNQKETKKGTNKRRAEKNMLNTAKKSLEPSIPILLKRKRTSLLLNMKTSNIMDAPIIPSNIDSTAMLRDTEAINKTIKYIAITKND